MGWREGEVDLKNEAFQGGFVQKRAGQEDMFADGLRGVVEEGDENWNHGDCVLGMLGTHLLHHPEPHNKWFRIFMEGMCMTFYG